MAILSPSILAADPMNLERDIAVAEKAGAKWLHIDVMDGNFVPNHSFSSSVVRGARRVCGMTLDVHLMIRQPLRYVENYCRAGADYLSIHVEADTHDHIHAALDKITELGVKPGIVLKPGTPAHAVEPFLSKCALVLVMTVEPGFGGQSFNADMMDKVRILRRMIDEVNPGCHLAVDGGVDAYTGQVCKDHGADVLVAGSSFYQAQDKQAFLRQLEK